MKKQLLTFVAALSLFAVLAPMGVSAQGNSEAAKSCQQGGYANMTARKGSTSSFANSGECVSAAAQGTIYSVPSISIERVGTSDVYGNQTGDNITRCLYWKTYYNFVDGVPLKVAFYHDGVLESISRYDFVVNGVPRTDIVPFGVTQVIVVTDLQTGEVILTSAPMVCEARA